jgi:hypothetical protein
VAIRSHREENMWPRSNNKFEKKLTTAAQARTQQLAQLDQALDNLNRALDGLNGASPAGSTSAASGNGAIPAAGAPPGTGASSGNRTAPASSRQAQADGANLVLVPAPPPDANAPLPELDSETLQLLTRFLSGAAMFGLDELMTRLRYYQAQMPSEATLSAEQPPLAEASAADLARYFVLGTVAWGRRQAVKAVYAGLQRTVEGAGTLQQTADRLTANPLLDPIRQPVLDLAAQLQREAGLRIEEGRREEVISRWLAGQTITDIFEDSIDYISESPQLAQLVSEQIGAQGLGLAGTVVDGGRQISSSADGLLEGLIRRVLRRKPRRELPPSPLAGLPQTMYETPIAIGVDDNDRA